MVTVSFYLWFWNRSHSFEYYRICCAVLNPECGIVYSQNSSCLLPLRLSAGCETAGAASQSVSQSTDKAPALGTSQLVQWLRICLLMQGTWGSIPSWGTKSPHAAGQLSPHTTTTELTYALKPAHTTTGEKPVRGQLWSLRSTTDPPRLGLAHCNWESSAALLPQWKDPIWHRDDPEGCLLSPQFTLLFIPKGTPCLDLIRYLFYFLLQGCGKGT